MNKTRTLAAALIAFGASVAHAQITYWDPAVGGNGHYYQPVAPSGGISWNDAKLAAEAQGGQLATLTSAAENNFVFSLIDSPAYWQQADNSFYNESYNLGPFLGGFQPGGSIEPMDGWQWLNTEGLFSGTYANWAPGQPNNNHPSGQDVTWFWSAVPLGQTPPRSNQWDDFQPFDNGPSYIIEYNAAPVPEPESYAAIVGTGLLAGAACLRWRRRERFNA